MKKLENRSVSEKLEIMKRYDADNMRLLSQREAASRLGVKQATLGRWLKTRTVLETRALECEGRRKRHREGKCPSVDEALLAWFKQASAPVNRGALLSKAAELAKELSVEFTATDGWLTRWKDRHGIVYSKKRRKKAEAEQSAADEWLASTWRTVLETYQPDNIYNSDETAVHYRATPRDDAPGGNTTSDRLTVLLTCNMTGTDKLTPLLIGKSKTPRCLKGVKHLPVIYRSNKNAWMTSSVFEEFLRTWDLALHEKIALLLDDCPAHPHLPLTNIQLVFLPPNTSSIVQPLNQGIVTSWKTRFRSIMRKRIIEDIYVSSRLASEVAKSFTVLDAMEMTAQAWSNVSPTCIKSCFDRELRSSPAAVQHQQETDADKEIRAWVELDEDLETSGALTDCGIAQLVTANLGEDTPSASEGEEEKELKEEPVTKREVQEAMTTLWRFMEQREEGGDFALLYKLNALVEKSFGAKESKKLKDYF